MLFIFIQKRYDEGNSSMRQYFVFIMLFLSVYLVLAEVNLQEKINNNGEAQFTADKAEIYSYNNLKFDVPKDAKVDYKDGLIVVTVPERSTIKKPGLIDPGKYAGVNLKYVSENGKPMLIEDGNKKFSLEGTVENKAVQKLEVFFDGKENAWYFSKARINGMVVGLTGETSNKDIYIFSDGDKHRDFGHAYFSYNGDKKISFGVPAGHKGMYVILREGNPIVPITNGQTALRAFGADAKWPVGVTRQSHISIENRDTLSNPPLVSTEGPFMIKNGNLYYAYEPYLNPEVPQFWNLDDHQQSAYLEIASRNHEGKIIEYTILDSGKQISKTLTKNLYMNNDNGAVFLDPADVSKNKNLIKLASLTQPERAIISTLMTLPPDKQQQILGSDVNGFLGQDIEKIRGTIGKADLATIHRSLLISQLPLKTYNRNSGIKSRFNSPILQDIKTHQAPGDAQHYNEPVTDGHETTHGINSYLRNLQRGNVNAFYLLDGKYVVLEEPAIRKNIVGKYIPESLRGSRYGTYISGGRSWDDKPLYIMDEHVAYINGAKVGVELAEKGKWNYGGQDVVAGPLEFNAYSLGLGMAIKDNDPVYWNSEKGNQFRAFLGYSIEETMQVYNRGIRYQEFQGFNQENYLNHLRQGQDKQTIAMRRFAQDTFGKEWTQRVGGF